MDNSNLYKLRRMATNEQQAKIKLLMEYATGFSEQEVPDPYTRLGVRFEHVLDMIEDAAKGVVDQIETTLKNQPK
jgi:protein-tyrosine phosphatase